MTAGESYWITDAVDEPGFVDVWTARPMLFEGVWLRDSEDVARWRQSRAYAARWAGTLPDSGTRECVRVPAIRGVVRA